jgi:hypothetical protein
MSKNANRVPWMIILGLVAGLATTSLHAGQPKKDGKDKEAEAEAKQFAQEEADEIADRAKGIKHKDRRAFTGRFVAEVSGDVMGQFMTITADKKPGKSYLVKFDAEASKTALTKALQRFEGKNVTVLAKLRVFDQNGEAKYLVINSVMEDSPTPPVVERRGPGGI